MGGEADGNHPASRGGLIIRLIYRTMDDLTQARFERDEARREFVDASLKANKQSLKAIAARARWVLANDAVRSLERDEMSFPSLA